MPLQNDSGSRANIGRLSVLQNSENNIKSSTGRLSVSQNSDSALKETKSTTSSGLVPVTPQRAGNGSSTKTVGNSTFASSGTNLKRGSLKSNNSSSLQNFSKIDVVPVIIPRTSSGPELATDSRSDAADVGPVLSKSGRRIEIANDSRKESSDVAAAVVPRTNSRTEMASDSAPVVGPRANLRMEVSADSAPIVPKSGRRLESSVESRKESTDVASAAAPKTSSRMEVAPDSAPLLSKAGRRVESATDSRKESADVAPVVPRTTSRMEMAPDSRREISAGRMSPFRVQSRYSELRKLNNAKADADKVDAGSKNSEADDFTCQIYLPRRNGVVQSGISEETREDAKPGVIDRMGFPSSAEPNTHRSENCMPCTLNFHTGFTHCYNLVQILFNNINGA